MITDALLAYFHFSAIFLLFAFLTVDAMLLRNPLDAAAMRLIARVDMWYFAAAILAVASGVMRMFWGAKGIDFYTANPMFQIKAGLVIAIGILSFPPTMQFMRWSKKFAANPDFVAPEGERRRVRRMVMIALHISALLPLVAVLMTRGFSYR